LKIGTGDEDCKSLLSTEGFTGLLDHPGIVVAGERKDRSKMGGGGGNTVGDKGTGCKSVGGKREGGKMAGYKRAGGAGGGIGSGGGGSCVGN
jgi:hypothetical protein